MAARTLRVISADRRAFLAKAGAACAALLYVLMVAKAIAGSSGPGGFHLPLFALGLALAPLALVLAARAPMIFPFGLFLALIPFDPLLSVSAGATLVRILGIASAITLMLQILVRRNVLHLRAPWYYWLAYVAWAGTSLLWTDSMTESLRVLGIIVQNFGLLTVLAVYPLSRNDLKTIATVMVLAGVVAVGYAFESGGGMSTVTRMSLTSTTGNVVDQNYFATSFILPIAFAFTTATSSRRILMRLACWSAVAVMTVGVLVSGSRSGFVAVGLMFAFFAWRGRSWTQFAVLLAGFVGLLIRFPLVWQRFMHDDGGGTGSGRTLIWSVGLHVLQGNWLVGTGIGSFPESYARVFLSTYQRFNQGWMRPAHNVLLGMAVELGIVGVALLVLACVSTYRSLRVIPRSSPNFAFRTACEGALLGLALQSLFIDPMWNKFVWLGLALPFAVLNLERPRAVIAQRIAAIRFGSVARGT